MDKGRLEAFSDGVIAIIITIMVLEITPPAGPTPEALLAIAPSLGSYIMSFFFVALYWNNHHHLLQITEHVNGKILWTNMLFLFGLSFYPVATAWINQTGFAPFPTMVYVLLCIFTSLCYLILQKIIVATHECSNLKEMVDDSRKEALTLLLLAFALIFSLVPGATPLAYFFMIMMVIPWIIPDLRFMKFANDHKHDHDHDPNHDHNHDHDNDPDEDCAHHEDSKADIVIENAPYQSEDARDAKNELLQERFKTLWQNDKNQTESENSTSKDPD